MHKIKKMFHWLSTSLLILLLTLSVLPLTVISETISATSEDTVATTDVQPQIERESSEILDAIDENVETTTETTTDESSTIDTKSSETESSQIDENKDTLATTPKKAIDQPKSENGVEYGLKDYVTVTDWSIYKDVNSPISATNPAQIRETYSFSFDWNFNLPADQFIKEGDFFRLPIPENEDWGFWSAVPGDATEFELDEGGAKTGIGTWQVIHVADGSPRGKYCIQITFNKEAEDKGIHQITGVKFTMPDGTLKNETIKGGTQVVTFGGLNKNITFEQLSDDINSGWDHKFASRSGKNNIVFNIGVGRATPLELAGDEVDYNVNKLSGFYLDGQGPVKPDDNSTSIYSWGEHVTNIGGGQGLNSHSVYVEDQIPTGSVLEELTISAVTHIPIGLTADSKNTQQGSLMHQQRAFEAYILKDYGNGPIYHVPGGNEAILDPKSAEESFQLLTQTSSDTIDTFRTRVKANPYQYGVYKAADGTQTLLVNFGNVGEDGSGGTKLIKYTDLTLADYSPGARTITRARDGVQVSVPNFAKDAASYCIANGFYPEAEREMLEDYFTLTYGEENAVNGQVVSFNIDLNLRYSPESNLSEEKSNTAQLYYQSALYQHGLPENQQEIYDVTGSGKMADPYGQIKINNNALLMIKYDGSTNIEMNGVDFTLQKREGSSWIDQSEHTTKTTNVPTTSGQVSLDGAIYITGLTEGDYRLVEKQGTGTENYYYPDGYDQRESPNYDDTIEKIITKVYEIDMLIPPSTQFISNIPLPETELAPYVVEHWLLKENGDEDNPDDYEIHPIIDNIDGRDKRPIGSTVTATPRQSIPNYRYKSVSWEVISGTIRSIIDLNAPYDQNGQQVLKLYYIIDDEAVPFTIYKENRVGERMPSFDENGVSLGDDHQVSFQVYKYIGTWAGDQQPSAIEPGTNPAVWELMTKDENGDSINPIKTDSKGRLQIHLPLFEGNHSITYALVETGTYANYKPATGWWIPWISSGPGDLSGLPLGTIKGFDGYPEGNSHNHKFSLDANSPVPPTIINDPAPNTITLYKGDEEGNPMPSDPDDVNKQVIFDIYEFTGNWNTEHPSFGMFDSNGTLKGGWTKIAEDRMTDEQGRIINWKIDDRKTYGLVEKTSYPGYEIAYDDEGNEKSYWVVYSSLNNEEGFRISSVNYYTKNPSGGYDDLNDTPDDPRFPGFLAPENEKNPTNYYMIQNKLTQPFQFSFIKENLAQNPVGEVEFELYTGKQGETLTDANKFLTSTDPGYVSYWQDTPIKTLISEAAGTHKGRVMTDLAHGNYLLVETKTFAGYQLPEGYWILRVDFTKNDPLEIFRIEAVTPPGAVSAPPAWRIDTSGTDYNYYLPNFPNYDLPAAGGVGMIILTILGIVLIGSGIIFYLRRPKKHIKQDSSGKK